MKKENSQAVFFISIVVAVLVILYGVLFSNSLVSMAGTIMAWVSNTFGWLYIAFVFFLVVFLAWLSFSKYGKIKLGRDNEKPEYSNFSWYAMLFCGGTGIGLVFWSIAEPLLCESTGSSDCRMCRSIKLFYSYLFSPLGCCTVGVLCVGRSWYCIFYVSGRKGCSNQQSAVSACWRKNDTRLVWQSD